MSHIRNVHPYHTLDDIINVLYQKLTEQGNIPKSIFKPVVKAIEQILRNTYQSIKAEKRVPTTQLMAYAIRRYLTINKLKNQWFKVPDSPFWMDDCKADIADRINRTNRKSQRDKKIYAVWNKTGVFVYYDYNQTLTTQPTTITSPYTQQNDHLSDQPCASE